ncbi:MAG: hypothetical protein V3S48_06095 [Candidatus Neomarinimicrobiota bacterium]
MLKLLTVYFGIILISVITACTGEVKIKKAAFQVEGMTIRGGIL